MVRFRWQVEGGYGALIPPGKVVCNKHQGILHATVELEIPGQAGTVEALITAPYNFLVETRDVGVAFAHGTNAAEWKGKLMTDLAIVLAKEGYVVVRYFCKQKEQRRQRIFEKALDACATSPYARLVTRWVLAGIGNGARVAAAVGTRCRGNLAGFLFMSYPLKEPMPSNKGGPAPDSTGPLVKLTAPIFFITASHDKHSNVEELRALAPEMPGPDKRLMVLEDHDENFKTLSGKGPLSGTVSSLCSATLEFVNAVNNNALDDSTIPKLAKDVTPTPIPKPTPKLKPKPNRTPAATSSPLPVPPTKDQPKQPPQPSHSHSQARNWRPEQAKRSGSPNVLPPPPPKRPMLAHPPPGHLLSGFPPPRPLHALPPPHFPFPHRTPPHFHEPVVGELMAHESLQDVDDVGPNVGNTGFSLEIRGVGASGAPQASQAGSDVVHSGGFGGAEGNNGNSGMIHMDRRLMGHPGEWGSIVPGSFPTPSGLGHGLGGLRLPFSGPMP